MTAPQQQGSALWYVEELRTLADNITGRGVGICNGAALMIERQRAALQAQPSAPSGEVTDWATIIEGLRLADQFFDGDDHHWQWDDGEAFPASKVRAALTAALAARTGKGA